MRKRISFQYILVFFTACIMLGCTKDDADQKDDGIIVPRIFREMSMFPENPDSVRVLRINESISFSGMEFSPAGKVKVSWKVNDQEVSNGEEYTFTATEGGDFRIRLEASYGDITVSRYRDVFVVPATYTPKAYQKIVLGYLTQAGTDKEVDWGTVTHLVYKVGSITAAGAMDVAAGEPYRRAEKLAGKAHMNGVPVMLGVSGALSADGWNVYNSNNFGAVITDAAKRAAFVQAAKNYITAKKMDGIDIMMTDIGGAAAMVDANMQAVGPLLTELRAALGADAIITATVTANYLHNRYTDLSAASWLNVHAFEDGIHVGPGAPVGQPSGYNYLVTSANLWKNKYPASKLVIGIPAFGLRYNQLDANGNNLSWGSYAYMPYRDILAAAPDAHGKEHADIAKGVYYNGQPLVTQKAEFLKTNGFLGSYLWAVDYDVKGEKGLSQALFKSLNP